MEYLTLNRKPVKREVEIVYCFTINPKTKRCYFCLMWQNVVISISKCFLHFMYNFYIYHKSTATLATESKTYPRSLSQKNNFLQTKAFLDLVTGLHMTASSLPGFLPLFVHC